MYVKMALELYNGQKNLGEQEKMLECRDTLLEIQMLMSLLVRAQKELRNMVEKIYMILGNI